MDELKKGFLQRYFTVSVSEVRMETRKKIITFQNCFVNY